MVQQSFEEFVDVQASRLAACQAALVLAKSGQRERAMRIVLKLARSGDVAVRVRAAECLMDLRGERSVMELISLMGDSNSQVRLAAIGALGFLRIHGVIDKLEDILENDPDIEVRVMAARVLGKLGNREGLLLIARLLNGDAGYEGRMAATALQDIIGQRFSPTSEGILAAKRYLHVNMKQLLGGGKS